jgi:hypothetical protein
LPCSLHGLEPGSCHALSTASNPALAMLSRGPRTRLAMLYPQLALPDYMQAPDASPPSLTTRGLHASIRSP